MRKLVKKLTLFKETIRQLENGQVSGGVGAEFCSGGERA
jgi:hypothetical protein